jgi:hypothetical protein
MMQTAAEARGIRADRRRLEWIHRLEAALAASLVRARDRRKGRYYKPVPEVRVRFTEEDIGA